MFKKLIVALISSLLILTTTYSAEQDKILQVLSIGKELNATDEQIANAIKNNLSVDSFRAQITGKIQLIAPDKVPKGSLVQIIAKGVPEKVAEVWRQSPVNSADIFLNLYDKAGNSVNIFWSDTQGLKTFELIVAENGEEIPNIEIATCQVQYGELIPPGPTPAPIPFPEPPIPNSELQSAVEPLMQFVKRGEMEAQDLLNLSEFYYDFAEVIARDSGNIIADTAVFRDTYIHAGRLMFQQTGMQGKYVGLSEIVDKIISDTIGLDIVPLTTTQAADILNAVAWVFYQPLKKGR